MIRGGDGIQVQPPSLDGRRERIERRFFEALDRDRTVWRNRNELVPARGSRIRRPLMIGALAAVAAAAGLVVLVRGRATDRADALTPSVITTLPGQGSRLELGEVSVAIGGATTVEVRREPGPGVILALQYGSVDCELHHRGEGTKLRVAAGSIVVEATGTRFSVARDPSVKVVVSHGVVRVTTPSGKLDLAAGESWTSQAVATAGGDVGVAGHSHLNGRPPSSLADRSEPGASAAIADVGGAEQAVPPVAEEEPPASVGSATGGPASAARPTSPHVGSHHPSGRGARAPQEPAPDLRPPSPSRTQSDDDSAPSKETERAKGGSSNRRQMFAAAQALEATDSDGAARSYQSLTAGSDVWAPLALYRLAELESSRGHIQETVRAINEYESRFPRGGNAEDVAWLRVEALARAGRATSARQAASDYLGRYPHGSYSAAAATVAGGGQNHVLRKPTTSP